MKTIIDRIAELEIRKSKLDQQEFIINISTDTYKASDREALEKITAERNKIIYELQELRGNADAK